MLISLQQRFEIYATIILRSAQRVLEDANDVNDIELQLNRLNILFTIYNQMH